jgi:hypothetical protein
VLSLEHRFREEKLNEARESRLQVSLQPCNQKVRNRSPLPCRIYCIVEALPNDRLRHCYRLIQKLKAAESEKAKWEAIAREKMKGVEEARK